MEYRFTSEMKEEYLHVKVQGDNTAANVRRWVKEGLEECARLHCSRVLVEECLEGRSLGVSETFWVVEEGCRAARMLITHMAYVDANPEHEKEMVAFAETVAQNRAVNVRVFCQVREAEAWLKGGDGENQDA